ncbi:MAG: uracil-DNA glycosylase [Mariprofundaceae bacterium]|nr:uracil-DNA glycosylase [Mariprofundaceae bacterium]
MSETEFLTTYLREIGVQTPVSLVRSGNKKSNIEESTAQTLPNVSIVEVEPKSMPMDEMDLASMAVDAMQCQRCGLAESRQHVVFGQGNPDADLLFIGEAPSSAEDDHGVVLVEHVGIMFDGMLKAIGLSRKQVYSLNVLQCLTPNHRDPKQDELDACSIWLNGQLDKVSPKVICVMGRVAAQALLGSDAVLHDLRGQWHSYRSIPVWVSYHPAYLLRSPKEKNKMWEDLLTIQKRLMDS